MLPPLAKLNPVSFSRINSGIPPTSAPTTQRPMALASITLIGAFSYHSEGTTTARAEAIAARSAGPVR